jgi:hypothetical protein
MRHLAAVAGMYSLFMLMMGKRLGERIGSRYLARNLTPSTRDGGLP